MDGISASYPYGRFDTAAAYNRAVHNNIVYSDFVNPLMTSMQCLDQKSFESDKCSSQDELAICGRDIIDRNQTTNPDFFDHNHVIIPYCSSDLWLGGEDNGSPECSCSDLACFNYEPDSPRLQFTFRGKIIFQEIFKQLQDEHGMKFASEILLAGSSAGGVGVMNHAQWVRSQMPQSSKLLLLLDSSWFVNFQDNIYRIFDGTTNATHHAATSTAQIENTRRLFNILSSNPACDDFTYGYPCCITAHCIMTRRNETGELMYYPESNQKTFALFSIYDVFLLAPALSGRASLGSSSEDSPDNNDAGSSGLGLFVDFLRIVGEYGGEMNVTSSMSYYGVGIFQYFHYCNLIPLFLYTCVAVFSELLFHTVPSTYLSGNFYLVGHCAKQ